MKPDWKDAPDWANWVAMDLDRVWTWFEHKPYSEDWGWCGHSHGKSEPVGYPDGDNWEYTLEGRS